VGGPFIDAGTGVMALASPRGYPLGNHRGADPGTNPYLYNPDVAKLGTESHQQPERVGRCLTRSAH